MRIAEQACCTGCQYLANYLAGMGWTMVTAPLTMVTYIAFSELAIPGALLYGFGALTAINLMQFGQAVYEGSERMISPKIMFGLMLEKLIFLIGVSLFYNSVKNIEKNSSQEISYFELATGPTIGFLIANLAIQALNTAVHGLYDADKKHPEIDYVFSMIGAVINAFQGSLLAFAKFNKDNIGEEASKYLLLSTGILSGIGFVNISNMVNKKITADSQNDLSRLLENDNDDAGEFLVRYREQSKYCCC